MAAGLEARNFWFQQLLVIKIKGTCMFIQAFFFKMCIELIHIDNLITTAVRIIVSCFSNASLWVYLNILFFRVIIDANTTFRNSLDLAIRASELEVFEYHSLIGTFNTCITKIRQRVLSILRYLCANISQIICSSFGIFANDHKSNNRQNSKSEGHDP